MVLGDRLRQLRQEKNISQGDIEKRTSLLRCHVSRVENGHTVPAVETLEKFARALEVPMYSLFYDGDEPPKAPRLPVHARRQVRHVISSRPIRNGFIVHARAVLITMTFVLETTVLLEPVIRPVREALIAV
jgi:transcriptional regulator with XRE-family HTH domain